MISDSSQKYVNLGGNNQLVLVKSIVNHNDNVNFIVILIIECSIIGMRLISFIDGIRTTINKLIKMILLITVLEYIYSPWYH